MANAYLMYLFLLLVVGGIITYACFKLKNLGKDIDKTLDI